MTNEDGPSSRAPGHTFPLASRRRSPWIALLLAASLFPSLASPQGTGDSTQGRHLAEAKCAACHGLDGNATVPPAPKLAGQDARYLYEQLLAFRSGSRQSPVMAGIVAPLSDRDFADAAAYYASRSILPDPVERPALVSAGERVFFEPRGPGMMGSCASCHTASGVAGPGMGRGGMMGRGMMGGGMMGSATAAVPSLRGQHAAYLVDQLDRFASGERRGTVMGPVAAALGAADRRAVAQYLATRP